MEFGTILAVRLNQTKFPAKGKRNIKEILMDTVEVNIGPPEPRGHIIQNFSENPAFKGRAFSDKGKVSASRPQEKMSLLEEKQVVPTKLCIMEGPAKGEKFDLKEKTMFIGRSARNDIQIKDIMVSRKHLKIFKAGETLFIEDLMSTNGTRFNGEVITSGEAFEVGDGDTVSLGNTVIRFGKIPSPESSDGDTSSSKHNLINERRTASPKKLELDKITGMFDQSLNIDGMLEKLLRYVFDTLPRIDKAAILTFNNQKGQVEEVICRSRRENGNETFRYNFGLLGRLVKKGNPVKISDTTYEAQVDLIGDMDPAQTSSTLYVPIIINTQVRGAMYLNSSPGPFEGFRKDDLSLLDSLSGLIGVAIGNSAITAN
jgi:pSer/pThr/pTyr-binding forkhead associated (FHA) protein